MNDEIQKKIDALVKALRDTAHQHATSFTLFVNCEEARVTLNMRSPEQLEAQSISMRNLSGDFIKSAY